jgi:hypothetical protein
MNSLIREVLFPSAAAIGLLVAAVMDSAVADESTIADTAVVVAAAAPTVAAAPVAGVAQVARAPSQPSTVDEAIEDEARPAGVERRCERTGRIGKFKITRCD